MVEIGKKGDIGKLEIIRKYGSSIVVRGDNA